MDLFRLGKTYRAAKRLQQIIKVFLRHGFGRILDQIRLSRNIPFLIRLRTFGQWPSLRAPGMAEKLREAFEELGPSFVKLAQILSSRPDIVGAEYADELKKLQDEVPPFAAREAVRTIEAELKMPIEKIFKKFDERPMAAASIAQVHKATLMDGSEVVVKVQRPGIKEQIETDIEILSAIARLMERHITESRFFNPTGIIEEFARTVRKEMNFTEESKNCERFRKNFEGDPDVYFPRVHAELLTEKVFVMERISGVRIDDIEQIDRLGYDRKRLARLGVDAYYKMIFDDGFFHADPHPGNIFVMPTEQIAFMDFGIVGRVSEELKETLANTFIALINRDFDGLIDNYIELGLVSADMDVDVFRREFKRDLVGVLEPIYGLSLGEINFAEYLQAFMTLAMKHGLRIPSELLLINKAMLILENLGLELDPNFDFIAASEPFASKLVREKYSPRRVYERLKKEVYETGELALLLPRGLKQALRKLLRNDLHMKIHHLGLENLIRDMDRSSNRLSFALVIAGMIISSAILHAGGVPPKIGGLSVFGFLGFFFAVFMGVWLLISIIRSGRL